MKRFLIILASSISLTSWGQSFPINTVLVRPVGHITEYTTYYYRFGLVSNTLPVWVTNGVWLQVEASVTLHGQDLDLSGVYSVNMATNTSGSTAYVDVFPGNVAPYVIGLLPYATATRDLDYNSGYRPVPLIRQFNVAAIPDPNVAGGWKYGSSGVSNSLGNVVTDNGSVDQFGSGHSNVFNGVVVGNGAGLTNYYKLVASYPTNYPLVFNGGQINLNFPSTNILNFTNIAAGPGGSISFSLSYQQVNYSQSSNSIVWLTAHPAYVTNGIVSFTSYGVLPIYAAYKEIQ